MLFGLLLIIGRRIGLCEMSGCQCLGEYFGEGIRNATICGFVYKDYPEDGNSRFLRKVGVCGTTRLHLPTTVSSVKECCAKSDVFLCGLKFSREIKANLFFVLRLVDVKSISVLPLFHDFR
jgi:hypothetical protein